MAALGIKVGGNRTVTVADVLPFLPPIGIMWPRSGGRHAGILGNYSLVMGALSCVPLTWEAADGWVRSMRVGQHTDYVLPTVIEVQMMVRVLPSLFAVNRLWSSETVADVPADAWAFDILTDDAVGWGKHFNNFAVAVRREPINWRTL
jgi:hypothetical protein